MEIDGRDHLFVNYGTEDGTLAYWLTLKLTSLGYRVWCDKFELLGGESYPKDITEAIKKRTFRMISLISKTSVNKTNPVKERTIASNVGKDTKIEDFIIPLNVDGVKAVDLDFSTTDRTYINFSSSWADGLTQLLKKLDKINTPKPIKEEGKLFAASIFDKVQTEDKIEILHTNLFQIVKIPNNLKDIQFSRYLNENDFAEMIKEWAFWKTGPKSCLSFHLPPTSLMSRLGTNVKTAKNIDWQKTEEIEGARSKNVIINLILRNLEVLCCQKGLKIDQENQRLYFPTGLIDDNKIHFVGYTGKNTSIKVTGLRIKPGHMKYRYHLSPRFNLAIIDDYYYLQIVIQLYFTDESGTKLKKRSAFSARKHLGKSWWNKEWLLRTLAIGSYLADKKEKISIGSEGEELEVISKPAELDSPIKLVENAKTSKIDSEAAEEIKEEE
jgi:hypothetical protein